MNTQGLAGIVWKSRDKGRTMKSLRNPTKLKPMEKGDVVQVIVETPAGSRNKFSFDVKQGIFSHKVALPAGTGTRERRNKRSLQFCTCMFTSAACMPQDGGKNRCHKPGGSPVGPMQPQRGVVK